MISCQKTKPVSLSETPKESVVISETPKESEVVDEYLVDTKNESVIINEYVIEPDQMAETIEWINPIPYGIKSILSEKGVGFDNSNFFNYKATYPSFQSLPDKVVREKVNTITKNYVDKEFNEFWESAEKYGNSNNENQMGTNVYHGSYEIIFINPDYCSIMFHRYRYRWTENYPININLQTGTVMQNADYFVEGYNFYPVMREYCLNDLNQQWKDRYEERNIKDRLEYIQDHLDYDFDFSFSSNGFYIYFDEFFSHASGNFDVTVPYSIFQDNCIMNELDGIYGKYDCKPNWNFVQGENFFIKYPELKNKEGEVTNVEFSAGYPYSDKIPSEITVIVPTRNYGKITFNVQIGRVDEMESPPIPLETREFIQIDETLFDRKQVESISNDFTEKCVCSEIQTFQNISKDRFKQITISLESSAKSVEDWNFNKQHLYYLVNQIISTIVI